MHISCACTRVAMRTLFCAHVSYFEHTSLCACPLRAHRGMLITLYVQALNLALPYLVGAGDVHN